MTRRTYPARAARLNYHYCETCHKRAYHSRAAAKAARTALGDHGLSIYRCDTGDGFHLGHLTPGITRENARRARATKGVKPR